MEIRKYIVTISLLLWYSIAQAYVTLPSIYSDGMVLEQNSDIKIWGWAKPKEPISVTASWDGQTIETEAAADATWSVTLHTPTGSYETYEITVNGWDSHVISNVMVGEVILCAGQSNMEWTIGAGFIGKDAVVAQANQSSIRMFHVDYRTSTTPNHDVSGRWMETTPSNVGNFSAIGYFIASKMEKVLRVPVGIINSSWGGTPIESWTPEEAYVNCDRLRRVNDELQQGEWGPCRPGRIYNAMIAPFVDYKIKGVAWYQGEENTSNPSAYMDMMFALVNEWRYAIKNDDLPFVYAQIAPYCYNSGNGVRIREHQRRSLQIPGTAMVVIGELGDTTNIHPQHKIEAGERFANAVLNHVYGKKEYRYEAPLFEKMKIEGAKAVISFSNDDGLHVREGKDPNLFEIAGTDGIFYPAKAKLVTKKTQGRKTYSIEVTSKHVKTPIAVRYAWSDTAWPNLYNANGVQASCFTTLEEF
ncbi:MAG: sialate O-acetylesterase [Bacteroidales bacterium]|nr:sialate O-acetylesterase [Bacteroidales bacterium]